MHNMAFFLFCRAYYLSGVCVFVACLCYRSPWLIRFLRMDAGADKKKNDRRGCCDSLHFCIFRGTLFFLTTVHYKLESLVCFLFVLFFTFACLRTCWILLK